jgi:dihydrofolate synthase/folylpolyglutamate synthase
MARSLEQWLAYLESIHPSAIDMGLERVRTVAQALNMSWQGITVITVGGTNGKGTTCKFLEQYLLDSGYSVGTYRSPHLLDYRERVTLNGHYVDHPQYVSAFETVEQARDHTTLTYFEFSTLAALVMMQKWQPDFVLLEVGLGGRLDATNIIDNDGAVITTIGLDHQDYLGDTREAIASEKAGIFRANKPIVLGELEPPKTLIDAAHIAGGPLAKANQHFSFTIESDDTWEWRGQHHCFAGLPIPSIPVQNVSTALATLEMLSLSLDEQRVRDACKKVQLEGRRQILQSAPWVCVDVAHNPQAAENLFTLIQSRAKSGHIHLVVGMLKDKDIAATLSCFQVLNATWYLASTSGPRGCPSAHLAEHLKLDSTSSNTRQYQSVIEAYQSALCSANEHDSIFVFGSFLTAAEVLAFHQKGDKID